jgi:ABC-2 type transport system permease protein
MTTFVMQPMIFLAGVFYPISTLPGVWGVISLFNPVHHNINILRYSIIGYSDVNPFVSLVVMSLISLVLFFLMQVAAKRSLQSA